MHGPGLSDWPGESGEQMPFHGGAGLVGPADGNQVVFHQVEDL